MPPLFDAYMKQESSAAARKPRDAASILLSWSSPTFTTSFESHTSELQTCWHKTQFNTP